MTKKNNKKDEINNDIFTPRKIYQKHINLYIFTVLLEMFAIFLAYKCNDGNLAFFDILMAACCAPFYIPYKLGTSWDKCFNTQRSL